MFSLLRLYIVEKVVLSCCQHFCLRLYAMILVQATTEIPYVINVYDFDNAKVIDIGNFRSHLTLES